MKRKILFGAGMTAAAVLLAMMLTVESREFSQPETDKPLIKIGATLPLSGKMSYIGEASKNTLDMALAEWQKRGTRYRYKLVTEDDAMIPKKVNRNVNRLVNSEKIRALLTVLTPAATEADTITNDKGIIHFSCAYGANAAEGKFSFNNITSNEAMAARMLEGLKSNQIKTIALVAANDSNSLRQTKELEDLIAKDGTIKIIGKKVYNPGTKDFKKIIKKLSADGEPDIFYINGNTPDASIMAKDLKSMTGEIKLTTINDFIEDKNRQEFDDLWFVSSAVPTDNFASRYAEQYSDLLAICAPNSYDNLSMLIWAYERTPKRKGESIPNNEDVVKTILQIRDWHGANGTFKVSPGGNMLSEPALVKIKNGRIRKIEK